MRKKQIISSLMIASVMLSNLSPLVTFAEETETKDSQESVSQLEETGARAESKLFSNISVTGSSQNLLADGKQYQAHVSFRLPTLWSIQSVTFLRSNGTWEHAREAGQPAQNVHTYVQNTLVSQGAFKQATIYYKKTLGSTVYQETVYFSIGNTKPNIYASDRTINIGDSFNPLVGVSANDTEDGDITSKVRVVSNNVNTAVAGSYSVTYAVTDSDGNTTTKIITVTVKAAPTNEKPVITASDKALTVGDSFNPLTGVTATDAEDGDLTSKINVTTNNVNTATAGTYSVTYSVTDSAGNTTTKTISVIVKAAPTNGKPVITASDKTLTVGDSFNPLTGVTATDAEDGDLTSKIKVTANNVNTASVGTYYVSYSVTDSAGNTTSKTISVTVKAAPTKPVEGEIVIAARDKTLYVGQTFNPEVPGIDSKGGYMSPDEIKVVYSNVNTKVAGKYQVYYAATDKYGVSGTKTITVTVLEASKPEIKADPIVMYAGETFNPLKNVTAFDEIDGDLTSKIEVIKNNVDPSKVGFYNVTYSVTNSLGFTTTKEVMVYVQANNKPVITAKDQTLKVGDTFDPLKDVTANDVEDGDLTSAVKVVENTVDTSKAGTYKVTYEVTDSQKNTTTKSITVTVKTNDAPVIEVKDQTVNVGDTFDELAGVTATDKEDGDLTDKIKVTENTVDTTKAGTYKVTYSVTDSDGNTTTKSITVTVKTNDAPVIEAKDQTINVGDTFDELAGVTATDKEDGNVTDKIQVTENTVDTTKAGTYKVTYSVTDSDGNTTTKSITVTVIDTVTNEAPVIHAEDKTVEVGSDFDLLDDVTATDKEDGDLTESIEVSGRVNIHKEGVYNVTYSVTDSDGNTTTKTIKITVVEETATTSGTISPNEFNVGPDRNITGTYTGDVVRVSVEVDGRGIGVSAAANGTFKFYVGANIKATSEKVEAIAYDKDGKELDRKLVTLNKPQATKGTIQLDEYTVGSVRSITGSYTGDVAKITAEVDGVNIGVSAAANGTFKFYAGANIKTSTKKVEVIALDASGKELDRKQLVITNQVSEGTIVPNDYKVGTDRSLTGTYTGDIAKISVEVDDTMLSTITVKNGEFKYYIGSAIKATSKKVVIIASDATGKEITRQAVKLVMPAI